MIESAPKPLQHKEEEEDEESEIQVYDKLTPLTKKQQKLVDSGYKQVKNIARKMFREIIIPELNFRNFTPDNFIDWGIIGLIEASKKFVSSKNDSFRGYAVQYIKGRILDNLKDQNFISHTHLKFLKEREEAIESLHKKLNREPTTEEIAGEMHFTFKEYDEKLELFPINSKVISLTDLSNNNEDIKSYSLLDALIQKRNSYRDSSDEQDKEEKLKFLKEFFIQLWKDEKNERNREIMYRYFKYGLTNKEIGKIVGLSEPMVSIITKAFKEKLKELFKKQGYEVSLKDKIFLNRS